MHLRAFVRIPNLTRDSKNADYAIEEFQRTMQHLRAVRAALVSLAYSVEAEMSSLEHTMFPIVRSRGWKKLPTELMTQILLETRPDYSSSGVNNWPASLRVVSKQFRDIVGNNPLFYNQLLTEMTRKQWDGHLEKSRNTSLKVIIKSFDDRVKTDFIAHAPRWKDITLKYRSEFHPQPLICDELRGLRELAPHRLVLRDVPSPPKETERQELAYTTWDLSRLTSLSMRDSGLPRGLDAAPLADLSLRFNQDYSHRISLTALGAIIDAKKATLKSLSLTFDKTIIERGSHLENELVLPGVERLQLVVKRLTPEPRKIQTDESINYQSDLGIMRFVLKLKAPALKNVILHSPYLCTWIDEGLVQVEPKQPPATTTMVAAPSTSTLPMDHSSPTVQMPEFKYYVQLSFGCKAVQQFTLINTDVKEFHIDWLIDVLEEVEDIHVSGYTLRCGSATEMKRDLKGKKCRPLRTLRLTNCTLNRDRLKRIINILLYHAAFPEFERLTLARCCFSPRMSISEILSVWEMRFVVWED